MLVVVEVVVDEEVGVAPLVLLEHLKREGYELAVRAEIIKQLCVYLCFGLGRCNEHDGKNGHHESQFVGFH